MTIKVFRHGIDRAGHSKHREREVKTIRTYKPPKGWRIRAVTVFNWGAVTIYITRSKA